MSKMDCKSCKFRQDATPSDGDFEIVYEGLCSNTLATLLGNGHQLSACTPDTKKSKTDLPARRRIYHS